MKLFYKTFASATLTAATACGGLVAEVVNLRPAQAVEFILNSTGFTPEAQTSFQYALDIWEPLINSPVPIAINATFAPVPQTEVLAAAGPLDFFNSTDFGAGIPGTYYPVALANALSGTDLNPSNADITATINSNVNWYYGIDPNIPAGQTDFVSTVLHEVAHGLGFLGSANVNNDGLGSLIFDGVPVIYDRFVVNGSSQSILDTSLFPNNSTELASQLQSNNLFFNGSNANAANGGSNPKLYAPGTWEEGSSYAHLDQATYGVPGNPNSLMTPFDIGGAQREPGPITLGIFNDMGYSVSATQEPTPIPYESSPALGLLLLGMGICAAKLKVRLKLQPNKLVRK
jgi:hypothetical protein